MSGRLPWVGTTLYLTVLAGGVYFDLAGISTATVLFVAGIVALLGLEWFGRGLPLMLGRAVLIHLVAAVDGSGLARVLFLLVPFAAYLAFGRRVGVVVAGVYGVGLVGWLTVSSPGWFRDAEQISDLVMFGVGLVFAVSMAAVAVAADASRARAERLLADLAASEERVRAYAAAEERNRLARDIHDSLGHHLTAVSIQLEKATAYRDRDDEVADRAVADARGSTKEALAEVRRSVSALRAGPSASAQPADPPSLGAALTALTTTLDAGPVAVSCAVDGDEEGHAAAVGPLFRAAQEGLTNALRHAGAARVRVTLEFTPEAAALTVRDDGRGLPSEVPAGFGLAGMRERLSAVGGTLRLESTVGGGTTLVATVPRG